MKVVILAGGRGTRLSEETVNIPKPLVEIGGRPIMWHIMKYYSRFGFNDFIICAGYKGNLIKEFFGNYWQHNSDICINTATNTVKLLKCPEEDWNVSVIDTGLDTPTGGRLLRVKEYLDNEPFMLTYGDGLSNIDINKLIEFHSKQGRLATVSGVKVGGRFGLLGVKGNYVRSFSEKADNVDSWISGGFFVFEPDMFNYLQDTMLEKEPLENLALDGQLSIYKHKGSWKCMDTLRDRMELEDMLSEGRAFWKIW